jgi:hypothetical protein
LISSLLQTPLCQQFLASIVFWDAKRPITKKLLQRIDLQSLLVHMERAEILKKANGILPEMGIEETKKENIWPENLALLLENSE